jgi:hypothetical protein
MTTIRKIVTSKIDGNNANANDANEIRPFGETAFYIDTDQNPDAPTLMVFNGVRTHVRSKVLRPGVLYGSNENSSDGLGYDTIKLIPDSFLDWNSEYTNDQYIIIEPTGGAPGHVHIRSGGTMDQSSADLFLGGELNHVKVSDTNDTVIISTDAGGAGATREWTFSPLGHLQFPGGSNGRIGEDEPGLVVYSDLSFGILTNLANTENSRAWIFNATGITTLPGGISGHAKTNTYVDTTIALDVTAAINKIVPTTSTGGDKYSLADGVEGQIMYLVPATGGEQATEYTEMSFAHARYTNGAGVINEGAYGGWLPFQNLNTPSVILTLIFTDGHWNLPHNNFD